MGETNQKIGEVLMTFQEGQSIKEIWFPEEGVVKIGNACKGHIVSNILVEMEYDGSIWFSVYGDGLIIKYNSRHVEGVSYV